MQCNAVVSCEKSIGALHFIAVLFVPINKETTIKLLRILQSLEYLSRNSCSIQILNIQLRWFLNGNPLIPLKSLEFPSPERFHHENILVLPEILIQCRALANMNEPTKVKVNVLIKNV